jgi:hypothetical protein
MRFDLDNLPSEPTHLQHLIRDMAAAVGHRDGEIERLKSIINKLQRAQFGRRSERLIPTNWRSRSKRSTAILPAKKRSVRVTKSKQANGPLVANRCPTICRAKRSASILRA